jgi:hypothetical protein
MVLGIAAGIGLVASCSTTASDGPSKTGSGGTAGQMAGTGGAGGANPGSGGAAPNDSGGPGTDTGADSIVDVAATGPDATDAGTSDAGAIDAVNGTPDGGAYTRTGWTALSVPAFPPMTDSASMGQDLKYANAFDGNYSTRWSTGDRHKPIAQVIGDQFTFDMQQPHVFTKILFWAGGLNGGNGPDPRDYPGALDVSVSLDCQTFGATIASGSEANPGCQNGATCNMPFVIDMKAPTTAQCVRLTLTKVLKLSGGIWWAIDELFVYP